MRHRAISVDIEALLSHLGTRVCCVRGPRRGCIDEPIAIDATATGSAITFCTKHAPRAFDSVIDTPARVIVCHVDVCEHWPGALPDSKTLIGVGRPRLAFVRILDHFFKPTAPSGIHPTATVESHTRIGERVYIGPYAYVAAESVGDDTVIHGHVHIRHGTRIGSNVIVHPGAVIGADGFGFERDEQNRWERFHHLGGVIIEDDVEVGANACIDRGSLGSTVIGKGAKIDNLVYIAHNVAVGEHAVVVGHATILGGARLGDRAWVAPSSVIRDKIAVGVDAFVGMGAVVTSDVAAGETVVGVPARRYTRC